MKRVIWIDDAAGYMLKPLRRMLLRRKFEVQVFASYQEAMDGLELLGERASSGQENFPDVIADLVIPRAESGTLDSIEVGFRLVRNCAELGAQRVVVFSVVSRVRVSLDFARLQEEFPKTQFFFLEKTSAGPTMLVDTLVSYLGGLENDGNGYHN